MIKFFKPRISIIIPLGLLVFDLVVSLSIWRYEIFSQAKEIESANLENVRSVMNRLQGVIEDGFRHGDEKSIASEIAIMGTYRNRELCFLTDEQDKILYATSFDLVGDPAENIMPSYARADKDVFLKHAAEARDLRKGEAHFSRDKNKIIAHYPVALSLREGEVRPKRIGILFLQYDLTSLKRSMRHNVEYQIAGYGLFIFLISVLLWVFFYFTLTRRVTQLIGVTQRFADGDMSIRARAETQDELGILGREFNRMIEKVSAGITERKKAEEDLRSEQQFTKALLDSLPGIFYLYTYPELRLVLWNKNHETLLGFTSAEMNNRYIMEWHIPGVSEIVQKAVDVAMEKGINTLESPLMHKDGHYIPFLMTGIRFESQGKLYLMGVGIDITERKKAEEKNLQLAAIVESSDDAIIGKDLEGKITSWNKGAREMYGYTESEVIGKSISILYPPDHKNELLRILGKVARGEPVEYYETERIRKDGTHINVSLTMSPVRNSQNKIIGASVIGHDISERKRAEQSQRLAQMGQLVSIVAHEINNPLMIISSAAQLSLMEKLGNKEVEENIKDIIEQCVRAKEIIQRFLMFARPSKGEVREVDVKDTLEAVVRLIEYQFSLDNIKVIRNYYASPLIVKVDDKRMQEVFMNLLTNAKDAMSHGGDIVISTLKEGDHARIEIKDTGTGISEENLKKLFQPFFTTKEKGVGLGLLVSNGIIQAYGGTLRYKSAIGKGTIAVICLPLERKE